MDNLFVIFKNRKEVLGVNDRTINYQYLNYQNKSYADNKLLTKKILKKNNIPTPELFAVIRNAKDLDDFNFESLPKSFVVKPTKGLKGSGIIIYYNRIKDGRFILANRDKHSVDDIKAHIRNILDGQYNLGIAAQEGKAMIEERVKVHHAFKHYSYRGIPDIRIIVYRGIPVMAMLRLPTKESSGKANLSQGAIGVGIDMARGVTTSAIKGTKFIEYLPETKVNLSGIRIPYWKKILRLSHQCQAVTKLGFLGVDIIIDKDKGPMVIELNSRPGLSIQLANRDGLKDRLLRVKKLKNVSEGRAVRLARDLFGGEIEEEVETITGREVIGLSNEVTLIGKDGKEVTVKCKIDTGAESSSIDEDVIKDIGYSDLVEYFDKVVDDRSIADRDFAERKPYFKKLLAHEDVVKVTRIKNASGSDYRVKVKIHAKIGEREFEMIANIAERKHLEYPVLLGKKDLKNFLIDTTKK